MSSFVLSKSQGISYPRGFRSAGISCGIKASNKKDLMLLDSESPCVASGVYTSNRVRAYCVDYTRKVIGRGGIRAILVNSGNANCLTGKTGKKHTHQMADYAGKHLGIPSASVIVASTGVIGEKLPIEKISKAVERLAGQLNRGKASDKAAAQAILTTDTVIKQRYTQFKVGNKWIRLGAVAKGSGMIHPNLGTLNGTSGKHATMLTYITTDAVISQGALKKALLTATQASFNCITVDADQSTNDMVVVLANGASQAKRMSTSSLAYKTFCRALTQICQELAQDIVKDAEGITKFVQIDVRGAASFLDAKSVAMSIATSQLVKTALFGCDPNWGRIAAAVGASGYKMNPSRLSIQLGPYWVMRNGSVSPNNETLLKKLFKKKQIQIAVDLKMGSGQARVWTSDLSTKYVHINAAYRT